ncbi:hypothetical protein JCM10207_008503 [Rhodosporidiobolus poonsookiae]
MEPSPPEASPDPMKGASKPQRAKRTYRACQPCRARKLKCDLGDPDNPSDPPCRRCRRESRECVFVARANAKTYLDASPASVTTPLPYTSVPPQRPKARKPAHSVSGGSDQPGPSAARASTHPYAVSPTGWGPSPGSLSGGAPSSTPNEAPSQPAPAPNYFYPSPVLPGQVRPYDPNFPLIPNLQPHASAAPIASTSRAEHPPPASHGSAASMHSGDEHEGHSRHSDDDDDEDMDGASGGALGGRGGAGPSDANVLLSSTLHNPSDALKLLATASSLRSLAAGDKIDSRSPPDARGSGTSTDEGVSNLGTSTSGGAGLSAQGGALGGAGTGPRSRSKERRRHPQIEEEQAPEGAGWERWVPVKEGMVTVAEAEVLLSFFQVHMSPLYPLLSPRIFSPSHLALLTSRESLLLASMITISARYSSLPSAPRARAIHQAVADYIRDELIGLLDGSGELRHISSVEALLLLTEWPPIADSRVKWGRSGTSRAKRRRGWGGNGGQGDDEDEEKGDGTNDDESVEDAEALLKSSAMYDAMSWSFIGCAVRLAQELNIHNLFFEQRGLGGPVSWQEERCLRTWIYCYNADRHVSVRLGRNAVIQAYMSSSWWEQVTSRASHDVMREGLQEVWAAKTLPQGLIAALMGTIQERLYPNKEITRSMLRSGHWESFIRSLDHELQMMLLKSRTVLQTGNIESTLLQMEFEYVRLYGNAIALRALQERMRRAVKAQDLWFVSPSLLNLQEGQWVLDALAAAQSILEKTVNYLAPKGFLKLAPSRIFQRILFAATFLFKALAVGVVEHGQTKVLGLLDQTISVLYSHAVDRQHIGRGFAALLRRLQAQCKPTLLSRFGVRQPNQNGDNGQTPAASHAGTPAPQGAPSPRPAATPHVGTPHIITSNPDAPLAPTPNLAAPSLPGSTTVTPRVGFPPLPAAHEHPHPSHPGAIPSPGFPSGFPQSSLGFHYPPVASFAGPSSSALAFQPFGFPGPASGEPTSEMGGFKLADLPDPSNPFEWDPTASNIAVGKEQDLLFQSLWGSGAMGDLGSGVNPALNLFGTLVGDEFGLE